MSVVPVEIVRPEKTEREKASNFIAQVGIIFLFGWLIMLTAGAATPWHPSYWDAVLVLIGYRVLTARTSPHTLWSRARTEEEK